MPFTPITLKPAQDPNKVLDIGFAYNQGLGADTVFVLDQSSYLWGWGGGGNINLTNLGSHASSPVLLINDKRYCRLGENGAIVLDESSYAWTWGTNSSGVLGLNIANGYVGVPSSVVGAKQWRTVVCTQTMTGMCGLDSLSYAWCWGSVTGDNTGLNRSSPVSVVGGNQFIKVKSGGFHFLGLNSSSYAWSWGTNPNGQLGDNTLVSRSSPVSVLGPQFIDIFTGYAQSYGLDSSSYLWAWGYNNFMQVGDGTTVDKNSPVKVGGPYDTLFTVGYTVFAKKDDCLFVWGNNSGGQFGTNNAVSSTYPFSLVKVKFPFTFKKTMGFGTVAVLDTNSNVWCWGSNTYGSCGIGNTNSQSYPVKPFIKPQSLFYSPMPTFPFIKLVSTNNTTSNCVFMLDASSYLWGWGFNGGGWLGTNNTNTYYSPVSVVGNRRFRDISTIVNGFGYVQVAALDLSSYLWCWGKDGSSVRFGINGDNTVSDRSSPVSVVGGKQFIRILCHSYGVMALDASSYLWNWGYNGNGEVGDNTLISKSSPVSVVGDRQVIDFTHSGASCTLLDANGYAWSWGRNFSNGYLGTNTVIDASSPVSVVGGRQFIQLAGGDLNAGGFCIWALDRSSYLWSWGFNDYGQLGDRSANNRSSPVSVVGDRQFIKIGQSWALDASSYLWTWGYNGSSGQLGDGTVATRDSPVSVIGGFQFGSVVYNKCGIGVTSYPNSQVIIWGNNYGNRDLTLASLPCSIPFMTILQHSYPYYNPIPTYRNNILSK